MKSPGHVMILASAGSGKTYALTNRFVELLARGASAERIVALTFTRKAAGEFFDEILKKLANAASQPAAAETLARAIHLPHLRTGDFLRLLRGVVDVMPRLRLGTLDGFFARIAQVFPFELGLGGGFEILEEHAARQERQRVLRRMFTRAGEINAAQQEFIEAFKRATFGTDEKQLEPRLDAFLDEHQERYLAASAAVHWGEAGRIWPRGNAWIQGEVDRSAAAGVLNEWIQKAGLGDKQRGRWVAFMAAVEEWSPGMAMVRELGYVLEKALDAWSQLTAGNAVLEFDRKKQPLSAEACAALAELTRAVVGGELRRHLATTRGIHAVLRGYETVYHEEVRRAGKLTFGDVQRLLMPTADGAGALTRDPDAEGRLFVDYRLDSEIDHWLLDEFQDTSYGQWTVLRNLIDEVVQDASGSRSFFCVGDVKQAIFTWREGDPRLFREILNHYNSAAPGTLGEEHLVESWRSGPALIEMVNSIFGDAAVLRELFPGAATDAWNQEWRAHRSAVPDRAGQAALLLASDQEERWSLMVGLLNEIRPLERGMTCAVLVPKNALANELADYLRSAGIPAVAESDLHVCTDNPLGAALLALVQAAAHPGDTMAWEHVQMTPLAAVLAQEGITTREIATRRLLAQLHGAGFERTMADWLQKLEGAVPKTDVFSQARASQFTAAAARYDAIGGRNVGDFVEFMHRHVVRDPQTETAVRVMTIHKSKGLGFDVVILPELQGKRIDERRGGLAVQKAADRTVEWILELPPKLFCEADDVLLRHVKDAEAVACYEAISLLYVAFTRAKRGLYAIIEPAGTSTSRNYPKLLSETLGEEPCVVQVGGLSLAGSWVSGDSQWYAAQERRADRAGAQRSRVQRMDPAVAMPVERREARRTAVEGAGRFPQAQLFSLERTSGAHFGSDVHALLAEVEWTTGDDWVSREEGWRAREGSSEVVDEAIACLRSPLLAGVWERRPASEVWRERAFEVVLEEIWVTGVFDRVVVRRGADGKIASATVFDFKTDRVSDEAAVEDAVKRYAPQLNVYRRVAASFTGLPLSSVACELVFTHLRRGVRIPW